MSGVKADGSKRAFRRAAYDVHRHRWKRALSRRPLFDRRVRQFGRCGNWGSLPQRVGGQLHSMSPDQLQRIFAEAQPDSTAEIAEDAAFSDLDPWAIAAFRKRWTARSANKGLQLLSDQQLLADAGLALEGKITIAALVLLGTERGLRRLLPSLKWYSSIDRAMLQLNTTSDWSSERVSSDFTKICGMQLIPGTIVNHFRMACFGSKFPRSTRPSCARQF